MAKGWTNGQIGINWIKLFDEQTHHKLIDENDYHLLILDGHNSHYTMGLIDYAINKKIIIICFPAHTTHVLQGLDVVIFSILKHAWTKHLQYWRDAHHRRIGKQNFLDIYGGAHNEAFTHENILASFAATGMEPFNSEVISVNQMKPSMEFSTQGTFPMMLPTPVKCIAAVMHEAAAGSGISHSTLTSTPSNTTPIPPRTPRNSTPHHLESSESCPVPSLVAHIHKSLESSSGHFLISATPIHSTEYPMPVIYQTPPPWISTSHIM